MEANLFSPFLNWRSLAMKIKLSMDAGAAFDILSIHLVKSQKSSTEANVKNYLDTANEIREQIGGDLFNLICSSEEFSELKTANEKVFEAVDLAKQDKISASLADSLNYQRFLQKKNLQQKYFNSNLTEQKIGY